MWSYDRETSEEEVDSISTGDSVTSDVEPRTPALDLLSQAVTVTEGLAELMTGGDENAPCEDVACCREILSLFSGLSASDRVDLEQATVLPQQIKELHNVRPKKNRKPRNMQRDPMKVPVI